MLVNKETRLPVFGLIFVAIAAALLSGCGTTKPGSGAVGTPSTANVFTLVAGSECRVLQPLFDQFSKDQNVNLVVHYEGSLDISQHLSTGTPEADAYMPSNSLWLSLGDTHKLVKYTKSIARTYVVFGLKESVARRLGWVGKRVKVADILDAAKSGKIRYMMTSATQSNSGASAYFGYLYAFSGHPEMLSDADLNKPQVRTQIKEILGTINRSAGSSGFLQDLFLNEYDNFDGMVNYESVIIATDKQLVAENKEPLRVIYPEDGLAIADYPLGFVDHGDSGKAKIFQELQQFLLSPGAQQQIAALGWRTSPIGMQVLNPDPQTFNPAWGVDTKRVFSPIRFPDAATIRKALNLYQTTFRKPSFTIYCLDYSGSMADNGGGDQLKAGMGQILDQNIASQNLLQASVDDVTIVIPFNTTDINEWKAVGNDPNQLRSILTNVNALQPDGGTNFYGALTRADQILQSCPNLKEYSPAIILMTDGQDNQGQHDAYEQARSTLAVGFDVPIYAIAYGSDADKSQLMPLAQETTGKVFDGSTDLMSALREVKGYN